MLIIVMLSVVKLSVILHIVLAPGLCHLFEMAVIKSFNLSDTDLQTILERKRAINGAATFSIMTLTLYNHTQHTKRQEKKFLRIS
jgi:hypothetical protein